MTDPRSALVGPSDIADLAGVSRAAVSNWRKRDGNGFPDPIGGTEVNPLFSLDAVSMWLSKRGYDLGAMGGEARIWGAMNALRGRLRPDDAVEAFLALACIRRAAPSGWREWRDVPHPDRLVRAAVESSTLLRRLLGSGSALHIEPSALRTLIDLIDGISDTSIAKVADTLLDRTSRSQVRAGMEYGYVTSPISQMLSRLALRRDDLRSVYDPACGIGTTLVAIGRDSASPVVLAGQDINGTATRIAQQRAFLWDLELDVLLGDTLIHDAAPGLLADVVVAEPPFGMRFENPSAIADPRFEFGLPSRASADLAWMQHCLAHLASTGTAYVVTTHSALTRSGADRNVRMEMLSRGCVRAVVALPGKVHPHTSVPLAVWVLQRPRDERSVLLIDATAFADAVERVPSWLAHDRSDIEAPHARVEIRELLAAEASLLPRRYIEPELAEPSDIVGAFNAALSTARRESTAGALALDRLAQPSIGRSRVVTVAQMVQQDAIAISAGRVETGAGDSDARAITARAVRSRTLEDVVLVGGDQRDRTAPGDVVVVTTIRIAAAVDAQGGHAIGTGITRLRILKPSLVLPDYLAAVLEGSWNDRFFEGMGIQRASLRELEVPLIPLAEQREVVAQLQRARDVERHAAELALSASRVSAALRDGVRYGTSIGADSTRRDEITLGKDGPHGLD